MATTRRGFGLAAAAPPEVIRVAAQMAESLGYSSFWVNDTPDADGLVALEEAATVTETINLGVGVVALSRRMPQSIVAQLGGEAQAEDHEGDIGDEIVERGREAEIRGVRLPLDRLLLGVGSGQGSQGALQRVRTGVETLKAGLDTRVFISALGPRMSRLAGEVADGVLFSWLTPEFADVAARWVQEGADAAERNLPQLVSYLRVSLGAPAAERVRQEAARYLNSPHYAAHFTRMGTAADPTLGAIMGNTKEEIQLGLQRYDGVLDEVVVRAITVDDSIEEVVRLVEAAAPL
jgi:alkanesulfonate monooxygenase SsuD/methylene tetrahydromethanopterin reductase-like flavin-dependent oxidoreductase (luciferase family)